MPECVVPRNEGEPNLTVQVNQKLLKDYFNTGEPVDHSIWAPPQSWASHKGSNFKGTELLPNANIKFLLNSTMMQCKKSVTNVTSLHVNT